MTLPEKYRSTNKQRNLSQNAARNKRTWSSNKILVSNIVNPSNTLGTFWIRSSFIGKVTEGTEKNIKQQQNTPANAILFSANLLKSSLIFQPNNMYNLCHCGDKRKI